MCASKPPLAQKKKKEVRDVALQTNLMLGIIAAFPRHVAANPFKNLEATNHAIHSPDPNYYCDVCLYHLPRLCYILLKGISAKKL